MNFVAAHAIVGLGLALAVSQASQAAPILNGTPLASPDEHIDFTEVSVANGAALTNQFGALGVSFSGFFYNPCTGCLAVVPDGAKPDIGNFEGPTIEGENEPASSIFFGQPVTDATFGFIANGGLFTMTALLNGSSVESVQFDGAVPNWGVYGFTGIVFDQIAFTSSPRELFIDNLGFNIAAVPEPVTLSLVGIALAGLGFSRRKRSS